MTADNWPKHPDGRNKKIGEMTRDEARAVFKAAAQKVVAEFERPEVKAKVAAILNGERVDN